jgi:hypothetical protein
MTMDWSSSWLVCAAWVALARQRPTMTMDWASSLLLRITWGHLKNDIEHGASVAGVSSHFIIFAAVSSSVTAPVR